MQGEIDVLLEKVKENEEITNDLPFAFNLRFLSYFLKDKQGDVEAAYKQVIDYLQWRKAQNIGLVELDMVRKELEQGKLCILPVEENPKVDILVVFKSRLHMPTLSPAHQFIRCYVYIIEAFLCEEKEHPGFLILNDMSGIGYANFDFSILLAFSAFQSCMPILPSKILIYNPPFIFRMLWAVAHPLLSDNIKQLIEVIYTKAEILKHIPSRNLPQEYGGEKKLHTNEWVVTLPSPPTISATLSITP